MRISIWQQFSSNHSASFTVVGTFADDSEANKAAAALLDTLKSICDWYNDPANIEVVKKRREDVDESYRYTPPELAMKEQFQLNDSTDYFIPIDWIEGGVDEAVHTFDNRVFVENTLETWSGYPPFPQLLTKLGAQSVLFSDEYTPSILAYIRCTVSDDKLAERIRESIEDWQRYFLTLDGIELAGNILEIKRFHSWKLYEALPAYIQWLQDRGCTDIHYDLVTAE